MNLIQPILAIIIISHVSFGTVNAVISTTKKDNGKSPIFEYKITKRYPRNPCEKWNCFERFLLIYLRSYKYIQMSYFSVNNHVWRALLLISSFHVTRSLGHDQQVSSHPAVNAKAEKEMYDRNKQQIRKSKADLVSFWARGSSHLLVPGHLLRQAQISPMSLDPMQSPPLDNKNNYGDGHGLQLERCLQHSNFLSQVLFLKMMFQLMWNLLMHPKR